MPAASRQLVFWRKTKRVTPCANSTSTSARVRTLAAVARAKARNQNCEAAAPAKPASKDGRHRRSNAAKVARLNSSSQASSSTVCKVRPAASEKVAASTKLGLMQRQDGAAIADGGGREQGGG